jgi:hypothetical protein
MPDGVILSPASLLSDAPTDRRVWERFAVRQEAYCRPISPVPEAVRWLARVEDVSADGARLVSRRFEPRSLVVVELHDRKTVTSLTLLGRVVWVKCYRDSLWTLGLRWTRRLSAMEVAPFAQGSGEPKVPPTGTTEDFCLQRLTTAQTSALVWA